MSFFAVDVNHIYKSSMTFLTLTVIGWILALLLNPFASNIPSGIQVLIYGAAYASPFAAAIYSWVLVIHPAGDRYRLHGLIVAPMMTILSVFILYLMLV